MKNSDAYSYPSDSSKLSSIGSNSFTHDAAGNITADVSHTYVYDAAGRVAEVKIGGNVVGSYVYDAANLRTSKTAGSTVTHYVYGKGGKLYGEYDSAGALIREYVYLHGQPLAQVDSGEVLSYLHTDHLGTPRYASNTSGVQVWNWSSDAFGNGTPTGSATVNLRFAGQYYDSESSLHYNWNRYYDPTTGRYITSDPIGLAGGINTYAYALANPVMYIDPEGLFVPVVVGGVARCSLNAGCRTVVIGIGREVAKRCVTAVFPPVSVANTADEDGEAPEIWPPHYGEKPEEDNENEDRSEICYKKCKHLLPSPSGDLQASEFTACFRKCMGTL